MQQVANMTAPAKRKGFVEVAAVTLGDKWYPATSVMSGSTRETMISLLLAGAMMEFILSKYGKGSKLVPASDSPEYALYLHWFWFAEGESSLLQQSSGLPRHTGLRPHQHCDPDKAGQPSPILESTSHQLCPDLPVLYCRLPASPFTYPQSC